MEPTGREAARPRKTREAARPTGWSGRRPIDAGRFLGYDPAAMMNGYGQRHLRARGANGARPASARSGAALAIFLALLGPAACGGPRAEPASEGGRGISLALPEEKRLRNVRQLTFGGENAEAYFSHDDARLVFQSTRPPFQCDQIYTMKPDGTEVRLVSSGKGRTTCGYWFPDGSRLLYSSTHLASPDCPPKPDFRKGYVWALYDAYDIFTVRPDGSDLRRLTDTPGYDAEATIARDGSRIVFTSTRSGDIDIYSMKLDGTDVRRLTDDLGYEGGAFFSADAKKIVYRAYRPVTEAEIADYKALLAQGLIRPTRLEIFVMDADGGNRRQVTSLGAASFAPYWHPDGRRIIFASNVADPKGRNFDLYIVNEDGSGLERVTYNDTFDGFPMFSSDGKRLVFASNRNAKVKGETNVFIADWVE
jgi:Tol biopolymer transport system component